MKSRALTAFLLLAFVLLAPGCARARDPWTSADTKIEAVFGALVLADCGTTMIGVAHGLPERNPLLGRHPNAGRIALAGAAGLAFHAGVAWLIPDATWRRIWQGEGILLEGLVVTGNTFMLTAAVKW